MFYSKSHFYDIIHVHYKNIKLLLRMFVVLYNFELLNRNYIRFIKKMIIKINLNNYNIIIYYFLDI